MGSKDAQNCWEFWNCPEEVKSKCPTCVNGLGRECWFVASAYQAENCPPRKSKGVLSCPVCPWYLKLNQNPNE